MAKINKTYAMASWFVKEILGQEWDSRFHRAHLKAAKSLLNPAGDEIPLDFDVVQICIRRLKEGAWGFDSARLTSLYAVTWGTPPFYHQAFETIKQIPPPYEVRSYDDWIIGYGRIAKRLDVWDGVYRGWGSFLEIPYRLGAETVAQVLA